VAFEVDDHIEDRAFFFAARGGRWKCTLSSRAPAAVVLKIWALLSDIGSKPLRRRASARAKKSFGSMSISQRVRAAPHREDPSGYSLSAD
jgi:hypothetical protein